MSGINSLSGLNKVNVDFRPTVSLDEQKKVDANEPGQPQGVVPGNAQQAKAESVVRQLDVLLLGSAKKSVASDIVKNVETVGQTLVKKGVLTDKELTELKTLAKDAADKMKALDKLSGRDIAKSMKIKKQETILNAGDDSGVIDLDAEDDDQVFVTSVKTETDWATNEADKEIVDGEIDLGKDAKDNAVKSAIDAQFALSDALSKFNEKLATNRKVDAALQDQFTELQFQCVPDRGFQDRGDKASPVRRQRTRCEGHR